MATRKTFVTRLAPLAFGVLLALGCVARRPTHHPHPSGGAPTVTVVSEGSAEGTSILPASGIESLTLQGDTQLAERKLIEVQGQPFTKGLSLRCLGGAANPWAVQVTARNATAIAAGDVLLASLWLRAAESHVESGEAQSEFVLELARDPWPKSVTYPLRAGSTWRQVMIPFTASMSYPAGAAQVILMLGYGQQVIEVADLRVVNFGHHKTLAELPKTRLGYDGDEPSAAWRAEAARRIETNRRSDVHLTVVDEAGRPVAGPR